MLLSPAPIAQKEASLQWVVRSTNIGKQLFTKDLTKLLADKVVVLVDAELQLCFNQERELTADLLAGHTKAARQTVSNIGSLDMLEQKRKIIVSYRGSDITMFVSTVFQEIDARFWSALKGLAVQQHTSEVAVLEPLWFEELFASSS